ncbi:MAG: hypothetical protein KJO34_16395, partial [Deltaproteobacteria bacterium]|nr:hypothetical protein [Deltaproteobacteria bacterium]
SSNSRRTNFAIMKRTYRTLNGCEMQYNAEVGLFTKPSKFKPETEIGGKGAFCKGLIMGCSHHSN